VSGKLLLANDGAVLDRHDATRGTRGRAT
jgi:hypothetical protein